MRPQELLTSSTTELDRLRVVQRVSERRMTIVAAAVQLGIS